MDFNFDEIIDEGQVEGKISFITSIDNPIMGNIEQEVSPENFIPVLPLRGVMLFPETMVPISIGRDSSLKLLKEAQKKDMTIAVFTQVDDSTDDPDYDQLYHTGVIGKVQKIIKLPDGSRTALLQGYNRIRLIELGWNGSYNIGRVELYPETTPARGDREFMAVVDACRETAIKLMRTSENTIGSAFALNNITVALEFMREPEVDARAKSLFLVASFLAYYIFLFFIGYFAREGYRAGGGYFAKLASVSAAFALTMALCYRNSWVSIAASALYVYAMFGMIVWRRKTVENRTSP